MRPSRTLPALLAAALALAGLPSPAAAQAPDLNFLALDWARGRYGSPLTCELPEGPIPGLRRILITPAPNPARTPLTRLVFVRLDVDEAERCFTPLAGELPNLSGQLDLRLPGVSHPDTAQRDFSVALRRERGFDFDVVEGHLLVEGIGPEPVPPRHIDFRGGEARLHLVAPGTDAARELAHLQSPRKLLLELESRDGERLRLPLALTDAR